MSETADFVRAVLDDNARLRAEVAHLNAEKTAEKAEAEKDYLRLNRLAAAMMARLEITRIEAPTEEWPLWGVGELTKRYDINEDRFVYTYDVADQPGAHRLELVAADRQSAAA